MNLIEIRQQIIHQFGEALTGLVKPKHIQPHRGQFHSLDEVKNLAVRAPAVLVAYRGFTQARQQCDALMLNSQWLAIVMTQDTRHRPDRNDSATAIITTITHHLATQAQQWTFADSEAQHLQGQNDTPLAMDKTGLAVWSVTWQQIINITEPSWPLPLTVFEGFHTDHLRAAEDTDAEPLAQTQDSY
jgi:phage gp37-like protein